MCGGAADFVPQTTARDTHLAGDGSHNVTTQIASGLGENLVSLAAQAASRQPAFRSHVAVEAGLDRLKLVCLYTYFYYSRYFT